MSPDERPALYRLETEVEAELRLVRADDPNEAPALSQTEWLFDPSEVERYRIGLYGLLGAVKALEGDKDQAGPMEKGVPGRLRRGRRPGPGGPGR
jgi:hypothetical protein